MIKTGVADVEIIDNKLHQHEQNKKVGIKILKISGKVLSWLFLIFILTGFGFSLASRITNNSMILGNTSYVVIATGSMEEANKENTYLQENNLTNQIKTYDIVGIQKVNKKEDIKLYDIIAFKSKDNKTIVHRVVEIKDDYTFVTKGDANINSDAYNLYDGSITFDEIIGKYNNQNVHFLGMFVIFLQSNMGISTIISLIICLGAFDYYKNKYDKALFNRECLLFKNMGLLDEKNKLDLKDESIIYKGEKYNFKDGKFISKLKNEDDTLPPFEDDEMLIVTYSENETRNINIVKIQKSLNSKSLKEKE